MKRKLCLALALILALSLTFVLTGCGAASADSAAAATDNGFAYSASKAESAFPADAPESAYDFYAEDAEYGYDGGTVTSDASVGGSLAAGLDSGEFSADEKIIYSGYAEVETTQYDESIQQLYVMIDECGGYLEGCTVTGNDYYASYYGYSNRSADFIIRVPRGAFASMLDGLNTLGNVPYSNTTSQNITTAYYDTASRLEAYRVQETRLLEMMEQAETVEDLLTIESFLAEVQYNIDSLTTTLRGWDSKVNYSTLEVCIQEVKEYTEPTPEPQMSYWQQTWIGLRRTLRNVGEFFKDLLQGIIVALPVLILLAVIAVVIVLVVRAALRRRRSRKEARTAALPDPTEEQDE